MSHQNNNTNQNKIIFDKFIKNMLNVLSKYININDIKNYEKDIYNLIYNDNQLVRIAALQAYGLYKFNKEKYKEICIKIVNEDKNPEVVGLCINVLGRYYKNTYNFDICKICASVASDKSMPVLTRKLAFFCIDNIMGKLDYNFNDIEVDSFKFTNKLIIYKN